VVVPTSKVATGTGKLLGERVSAVSLNREAWLTEVAARIEPLFKGYVVAPYRVTCGWPATGALGLTARRVGECHGPKSSKGGLFEVFISPLLDDSLEVAGTLAHEMAHVVAGIEAKHGKVFKEVCGRVGLTTGKATEAMPGKRLNEQIADVISQLGGYPHLAMDPFRSRKICPPSIFSLMCLDCGCRLTMSVKWMEIAGLPTCGCGGVMEIVV
jgi:hypothetical protein